MPDTRTRCDDSQLLAMLRTDDTSPRRQTMVGHVETCPRCQTRLTELAAGDDQWQKVASALSDDDGIGDSVDLELEQGVMQRLSHLGDPPDQWNKSMARQLLDPPSHPEMLGRLGRYEIERLIGSGGMGIVFKAHDTELNRPVAIKMLTPYLASSGSARNRFAREARAAAGIVDDYVVPIHNVESESDPPFLVMQYVAGGSLQEKLDSHGPLEVTEIVRIGLQAAKALAAAHNQGLIHRDVKPSNILLDEGVERALLTDFGLARTEDDAQLTRSGFQPGTPHYMSPEQVRGESIDGRSDLFGLGCVMYALCTGRPPFRADTGYAVLRRITDDAPRSIREVNPDIPDWLEQIVMKLLEKDRHQRYQSAEEIAEALSGWLAHLQQPDSIPAPAVSKPTTSGDKRTRRAEFKYLLGAVAGLLLSLSAIMIILETSKGTIRIESDVESVPIRIMQGDKIVESLTVSKTSSSVRLAAGKYQIEIDGDIKNIAIHDGNVTLARGDAAIIRIMKVTADSGISARSEAGTGETGLLEVESLSKDEIRLVGAVSQPMDVVLSIPAKPDKNLDWKTTVVGNYRIEFTKSDVAIDGKVAKGVCYTLKHGNVTGTDYLVFDGSPIPAGDVRIIDAPDWNVSNTAFNIAEIVQQEAGPIPISIRLQRPSDSADDDQSVMAIEGRWRRESTTVLGRDREYQQKLQDFAIFGQRTVRFFTEGREDNSNIYAYYLRPNGEIIVQAFRNGELQDIILGRVWRDQNHLFFALNMRDFPDGSEFPVRASTHSPETTQHDVLYFSYVREPWTETDQKESLYLDKRVPPISDPTKISSPTKMNASAKFGGIRITDEMCRVIVNATSPGQVAIQAGETVSEAHPLVGILAPAGLFDVEFKPFSLDKPFSEGVDKFRMTVVTEDGEARERVVSTDQLATRAGKSGRLKIRHAFGDDGPVREVGRVHIADLHFPDKGSLPVFLTFRPMDDVVPGKNNSSFIDRLQGKWKLVRQVTDDGDTQAIPSNASCEIDGNRLVFEDSNERKSATWRVDETKSPTHIDLTIDGDGKAGRGLIALEDGRLKLCLSDLDSPDSPRPEALEPIRGYWYMEFVRPDASVTERDKLRLPMSANTSSPPHATSSFTGDSGGTEDGNSVEKLLDGVPLTVDGLALLQRRLPGTEIELVHEIRTEDNTYTASYWLQYRGANYCLYMEKRRWKKLYEFTLSEELAESENATEPFHIAVANRKPVHFQVAAIHATAVKDSDEVLGFEYRKICEYFEVPTVTIEEGFGADVKRLTLTAPEGYTLEQVIESLKAHTSTGSRSEEASNE